MPREPPAGLRSLLQPRSAPALPAAETLQARETQHASQPGTRTGDAGAKGRTPEVTGQPPPPPPAGPPHATSARASIGKPATREAQAGAESPSCPARPPPGGRCRPPPDRDDRPAPRTGKRGRRTRRAGRQGAARPRRRGCPPPFPAGSRLPGPSAPAQPRRAPATGFPRPLGSRLRARDGEEKNTKKPNQNKRPTPPPRQKKKTKRKNKPKKPPTKPNQNNKKNPKQA